MSKIYRLFNIKNTTFYGTQKDLDDYNKNIGNSTKSETNIHQIIKAFENNSIDKELNFMVCKLGQDCTLSLLWNSQNKHNSYAMLYNNKTDSRLYSVDINEIPDSYNDDIIKIIVDKTPQMCKFSERIIQKQKSKDIWMLKDLQNFANAIDKYVK